MRNNWIFQLAEPLNEVGQEQIERSIEDFLEGWKAHGAPVSGYYEIRHFRFVILKARPGDTSGCSIDNMQREVAGFLEKASLKRLESNMVGFRNETGNIEFSDFREIESLIQNGKIGPATIIFDLNLNNTDDLLKFEVPLSECWLNRFLPEAKKA